jgi:hypothetical protein
VIHDEGHSYWDARCPEHGQPVKLIIVLAAQDVQEIAKCRLSHLPNLGQKMGVPSGGMQKM